MNPTVIPWLNLSQLEVSRCTEEPAFGGIWRSLRQGETFLCSLDMVVCCAATAGLMLLDKAGIVHNDIKPDNLIWTKVGKLGGFGR